MKLSTRSRYGLRFMFRLAQYYGSEALHLSKIAEMEGISQKYLGQIVIQLKGTGLIDSRRGAHGGYFLTREPSEVTALEIVEVLEGGIELVECYSNRECERLQGCPTRRIWDMLTERIVETLGGITLEKIVRWYEEDAGNLNFEI